MIINGKQVAWKTGETVLQVAKNAGIDIPHLCAFEGQPTPAAACRLCIVEIENEPRMQTSCTLKAREDMAVMTHTRRIQKARKNIVELLLASHPEDCMYCPRSGDCELAKLANDLGIRDRRYSGLKKNHPIDISSPSVVREPNKCILCGRCVSVCHEIQQVGAIDFAGRGYETRIDPAFYGGLNVSGCIYCGQCIRVCPTGALTEKNQVSDVIKALSDPGVMVVAQLAPAIPATLSEGMGKITIRDMVELISGALKQIGFARVFDTTFTADLTIMEEVSELIERVTHNGALPMFTSCSPGWVRYVELYRPELIPHMSTCKSPQQMAGTLIKEYYKNKAELAGRRIYMVSIMPCTAKKYEAQDLGDVDAVLSTREVKEMLRRFNRELKPQGFKAPLDEPFAEATGAGRIFGGSGGVMEAAIRTAHKMLTNQELKGDLKISEARGLERLKIFSLKVNDMKLNFAVVNGLGEVPTLLNMINQGDINLHFVEVMTCPGGCVGGGGQPHNTNMELIKKRLQSLYNADLKAERRLSHENEQVQFLYRSLLGAPLSEMSHKLLHRSYAARGYR